MWTVRHLVGIPSYTTTRVLKLLVLSNTMSTLSLALFGKDVPISQPFGLPNASYQSGIHNGTDYAVPENTSVHAPFDGSITLAWQSHPSMGNACLFQEKGTSRSLRLLHLARPSMPGFYKKGAVIAVTGNTGKSTGPHLHLEVWRCRYFPSLLANRKFALESLEDPETVTL